MNLEPRIDSKSLWWDGAYGGVTKGGKFLMLYHKPTLTGVQEFDFIKCNPMYGVHAVNYRIYRQQTIPLTGPEISAIEDIIDFAIPDAGGGGGGGGSADDAIVNLVADGTNPNLVWTKGNGTRGTIPFKANIQNTPAHNMGIQVKSNGMDWWYADGGLPRGIPAVSPETIHYPPPSLWDMEGSKRDADYNKDDGSFEILANNVEVSFMTTMSAGMNADSPHFSKGIPRGDFGFTIVIDYSGDGGKTWTKVAEQTKYSMTGNPSYPNSQVPCISIKNSGFKFNAVKAGRYRVGYKLVMGSQPELYPEFLMFYSCWEDADAQQPYYHMQMTGTIKNVSTPEPIPPHQP